MKAEKCAVLLLAGVGSWWWTQGCHEFHACSDGRCEPSHAGESSAAGAEESGGGTRSGAGGAGGASSGRASDAGGKPDGGMSGAGDSAGALAGGAAGEESVAGQAGAGGDATCVFPLADCDESVFTGCEANLLTDIRNCGDCRAPCSGACVDGKCKPFEMLAEDMRLPAQGGIALTSNEIYALSTVFTRTLVRWSPQQGAQTLFEGNEAFYELLSGVDRLYLLGGGGALSSILFSGGAVSSESFTAVTAVIHDSILYAVDDTGAPYWRSETSHETGPLPLPEPAPDHTYSWLAADDFDLALVTANGDDDAPAYTVYYLDHELQPAWARVTSGSGRPAQARVESRAVYIDVVLAHDEAAASWQIPHELREVDFDGTTRVVSTLTGLLDFELVNSRLYLSVELPEQKSVLRVLAVDNPSSVLEVQTSAAMASLTYSQRYFYFGDSSRNRLSRLRNWIE
ncbi:MAG TPA: hypothetical protein VER04_28975 [Polyangiaceae bacterium]|nr:hypothetical protein [Polyangiaceae bacterium]